MRTGRLLKLTCESTGYWRFCLPSTGSLKIHRLVASLFVPNPDPMRFKIVHHKNGDASCNEASNLEWSDVRRPHQSVGALYERLAPQRPPPMPLPPVGHFVRFHWRPVPSMPGYWVSSDGLLESPEGVRLPILTGGRVALILDSGRVNMKVQALVDEAFPESVQNEAA